MNLFNKKENNCDKMGTAYYDCALISQLRNKQSKLKECYKEYHKIRESMKIFPEYLFKDYYDRRNCVGEESYGEQFLNRFLTFQSKDEQLPYYLIKAMENKKAIKKLENEIEEIKKILNIE